MVIVPHHVYLALSDLEQAMKKEKELAQKKASDAALMNADECAFWAAYSAGMGDALIMLKGLIGSL